MSTYTVSLYIRSDQCRILSSPTRDESIGTAFSARCTAPERGPGCDKRVNPGRHVQAFLSEELSEEIQIKGRTARQTNKGTFMLILLEERGAPYKGVLTYT